MDKWMNGKMDECMDAWMHEMMKIYWLCLFSILYTFLVIRWG